MGTRMASELLFSTLALPTSKQKSVYITMSSPAQKDSLLLEFRVAMQQQQDKQTMAAAMQTYIEN